MTSGVYDFTNDATFLARYQADPTRSFGPTEALGIVRRHEVEVGIRVGRAEIGNRAAIYLMGDGDDTALRGLAKHLGETNHRHGAGRNDIGQHLSGSDGGKLVDVADDQHGRIVGNRLQERLHQHDVHHGGLIDNQQVAMERIVTAALETAGLRIDLKQPMNGFGFKTGRLGHALGGAASWSA